MSKSLDDSFRDWEGEAFGFGYGTGEPAILPTLHAFMSLIDEEPYDYHDLEQNLSAPVAWFLINALCRDDALEYGASPRRAWLTKSGRKLRSYVVAHTPSQLVEIICNGDNEYVHCYKTACNCGPTGYQEGVRCANPFWER